MRIMPPVSNVNPNKTMLTLKIDLDNNKAENAKIVNGSTKFGSLVEILKYT